MLNLHPNFSKLGNKFYQEVTPCHLDNPHFIHINHSLRHPDPVSSINYETFPS